MQEFLEHARRGHNAWWRYVASFAAVMVLTVFGIFVAAIVMVVMGMDQTQIETLMTPAADPVGFFVMTGVTFGILLALLAGAIPVIHRKSPLAVLGRWRWRHFAGGILIWAGIMVVLALIDYALSPQSFTLTGSPATLNLAGWALASLAVQTFAEEYAFRGYITQGLLLAIKKPLPTAIVSGLIFGAMHIPNGWPQAAGATVMGIALALIAMQTGGIAFGSGLHLINNFAGAVILVSANDVFEGSPALVTQDTPHLMWWDTAAVSVAIVAIAAVMHFRRKPPAMDVQPAT